MLIVAAIGIPMLERTSQLYRQALANWDSKDYAVLLPPRVAQFRLDLQTISARLALIVGDIWAARSVRSAVRASFAIWDLLLISAVMQAGLALPMAYYFHRVPLTQWMMPAAVLALALGYVSLWLAKLPSWSRLSRSTESPGPFTVWVDSTWLTSEWECPPLP